MLNSNKKITYLFVFSALVLFSTKIYSMEKSADITDDLCTKLQNVCIADIEIKKKQIKEQLKLYNPNNYEEILDEIKQFETTEKLDLFLLNINTIQLQFIISLIALKNLTCKVKKIELHDNSLEELPENFCKLINLEKLGLNQNQLKILPKNFGNLVNLSWLHLCKNQLQTLPESFCNLINLQKLYLEDNQLKKCPKKLIFKNKTNTQFFLDTYFRNKEEN